MDVRPDIPPDVILDIHRLPTAFKGYDTAR